MTCMEFEAFIDRYLDCELNDSTAEQIEAHLKQCSACRALLKQHQSLLIHLSTLSEAEQPESLHAGIMAAIQTGEPKKRLGAKRWAAAAAAVLVCAVSFRIFWPELMQQKEGTQLSMKMIQEEPAELQQEAAENSQPNPSLNQSTEAADVMMEAMPEADQAPMAEAESITAHIALIVTDDVCFNGETLRLVIQDTEAELELLPNDEVLLTNVSSESLELIAERLGKIGKIENLSQEPVGDTLRITIRK